MPFLEVDNIKTFYGNIQALKGISITVEEGECVTLIGSNGAGKSTTLRSISGLTPPRTGSIKLAGEEISHLPAQEIVGLGIAQSPEGRKCFQRMTVRENLELGAYLRRDSRASRRTWRGCSSCSRGWTSASRRRRARCPAASSRCSRSGAR